MLNPNAAPVLVKLAPPFTWACQFLWVVSFVLAGLAIIYSSSREDQLPLIVERSAT